LKQTLFSKNETLSIIRFVAMELALKHGADTPLYLYIYKGLPVFVSTTKIDGFSDKFIVEEQSAKKIILSCLYSEYPMVTRLAFVLSVNRILSNSSKLEYVKKIGVDISTYRLMEEGFFATKGVIQRVKEKVYQFEPETILEQLEIPIKELKYSFTGV
jgi:hypothetical protein